MPAPAGTVRARRRGGHMRGHLSDIARRRIPLILYVVLVLGALVDIATFYEVLARVLVLVTEEVLRGGVVGFTVVALTLAHMAGTRIRHRTSEFRPFWTSIAAWICLAVWLSLGSVAFLIRLFASDTSPSQYVVDGQVVALEESTGLSVIGQVLPALLFLSLYLATGTIAGLAGYTTHQPGAERYRDTTRDRSKAAERSAQGHERLAQVTETVHLIDKHGAQILAELERAEAECDDLAKRLRSQTRIALLAKGDLPWPNGEVDS